MSVKKEKLTKNTRKLHRAYLNRPKNKWEIVFEDKDGKQINAWAIPPTNGDRVDIICYDDTKPGYVYDAEVIVINIKNGEPELFCFFKPE